MKNKIILAIASFLLSVPALATPALSVSTLSAGVGKVESIKDGSTDVTSSYTLSYPDSTIIKVTSFGASSTLTGYVAGSYSVIGTSKVDGSVISLPVTVIPGAAARLVVVSGNLQSATVSTPYSNPLVAQVQDTYKNPISGAVVSFKKSDLTTETATTDSSGNASLVLTAKSTAGTDSVTASASGVSATINFSETAKAPLAVTSIKIANSPKSSMTVGTVFSLDVTQYNGTTVVPSAGNITVSAYANSGCTVAAVGTLSGTLTQPTSSGVANFTDLSWPSAGTIYIKAAQGSLVNCSPAIVMTSGVVPKSTKLGYSQAPQTSGTQNTTFFPAPKVAVYDQTGKLATAATDVVTINAYTDSACSTLASGSFTGNTVTASAGYASFTSLKYNGTGVIYIGASAPGLTPVCSSSSATIAQDTSKVTTKISFSSIIVSQKAASTYLVKVALYNINNSLNTGATADKVSLSLYSDSTCGVPLPGLTGGDEITAVSGYASFSSESIANPGTVYIGANDGNLTTCSPAITVTSSASGVVGVVAPVKAPSATGTAAISLAQAPTYQLQDVFGVNVAKSTSVGLKFYTDSACSVASTVASKLVNSNSSGLADFSPLQFASPGTYYVQGYSGTVNSPCSSSIVISCSSSTHNESGTCVSNIKSCPAADLTPLNASAGNETWNGTSAYGSCVPSACSSGYTLSGGVCVASSQSCSSSELSAANATAGTKAFNSTTQSYGSCTITACSTNFTLYSGVCNANQVQCSGSQIPSGATAAAKNWTGSGYGQCVATQCQDGYNLDNQGFCTKRAITCNANQHLNATASACDMNVVACSSSELSAINGTAGTKTWDGTSAYGACIPSSCVSGNHVENNTCLSDSKSCPIDNGTGSKLWNSATSTYGACTPTSCNAKFHANSTTNTCDSDSKSCPITNGVGAQTWNATSYGPCEVVSCTGSYHANTTTQTCDSDVIDCTAASGGGTGKSTWNGNAYGTCVINSCPAGNHVNTSTNACEADSQACTGTNGSGTKTWNGSSYGACYLTSCVPNFSPSNGACVANSQSCPIQNGVGTQTWNGTSFGTCTVVSCSSAFHANTTANSCDADVIDCPSLPQNATAGKETFTNGSYSACQISACADTFHVNTTANSCDSNSQTCSVTNGTGVKTYANGQWSSCVATTCDYKFHLNTTTMTCDDNRKLCSVNAQPGQQFWDAAAGHYELCNPLSEAYNSLGSGTNSANGTRINGIFSTGPAAKSLNSGTLKINVNSK